MPDLKTHQGFDHDLATGDLFLLSIVSPLRFDDNDSKRLNMGFEELTSRHEAEAILLAN